LILWIAWCLLQTAHDALTRTKACRAERAKGRALSFWLSGRDSRSVVILKSAGNSVMAFQAPWHRSAIRDFTRAAPRTKPGEPFEAPRRAPRFAGGLALRRALVPPFWHFLNAPAMPSTPRFFVDQPLTLGEPVALPRPVAHHALRVLRLSDQAEVVLFNGSGGEFRGRLQQAGQDKAEVLLEHFDSREAELPYPVMIGQGMCASDKMDWLIEKAVELGASQLVPLALSKSVVRLSQERAEKRVAHWRQLITAAAQQCGRNKMMQIEPPTSLASWLDATSATAHRLVLSPTASCSLAAFARQARPGSTSLLIGPEGGLTAAELDAAVAAGLSPVGLGRRVLRTESASMVALATLNSLWED
jgi:16S rRNA (uracil1498-N3)-methyltransferase